jgi:hypothetical protein
LEYHLFRNTLVECGFSNYIIPDEIAIGECPSEEPFIVTVEYTHTVILAFFFPDGLTLMRSAEMMVP